MACNIMLQCLDTTWIALIFKVVKKHVLKIIWVHIIDFYSYFMRFKTLKYN